MAVIVTQIQKKDVMGNKDTTIHYGTTAVNSDNSSRTVNYAECQ